MSSKAKMSYNCRIVRTVNGELKLGLVSGCYKIKKHMEWKTVPDSVRKNMAKKLGVVLYKDNK